MNYKFITILFFLFSSVFSQQKNNISGKLTSDKIILTDVLVELQINKSSKFAVSDKNGLYKFTNINAIASDSLFLRINLVGYENYTQQIENLQPENIFDIILLPSKIIKLDEVAIIADKKIINKASKSIYKINSRDFIKNAKAEEVLKTVPNVYIENENVIVDGKLPGKLFIDGIEMMSQELSTIDAADIDKVEINSNPSSSYGSDFMGAIVNIITKVKTEEFIKGSIASAIGARNDYSSITPSISYKRGRFTVKSLFNFKSNFNNINYSLTRVENNNTFFQNNINNSKGEQVFSQTRINIKLSEKSDLNVSGLLSSYKFIANAKGFSTLNNVNPTSFTKTGNDSNKSWNIASVYKYKINNVKSFLVKGKYYEYDNINNFTFSSGNTATDIFDIQSKNKELSTAVDYEAEELTVFKKKSSFYSGLKYIHRNFSFSNTSFYINQNIINGNAELDIEWSDKFSTDIALTIENTKNYNAVFNQDYTVALPVFNAIYHFKNEYDAKFGYSRKILRPDADELNTDLLLIYPGLGKQGNANLDPQYRNYYSFTISKALKSNNFSLKFYNESINNAIVETLKTQGSLVIRSPENAAKYNSLGMNLGIRTKLFKKINANLNSGFDFNTFQDNSPLAIIKENSGYTFRGNLNLNTKLFKDKVSVSLSGRQEGPEYSLFSKSISYPSLNFSIDTNLFKDKIGVSLYARDLLRMSANSIDISSNNNFYQKINIKNDFYNFILTLTYNFGKKFNDKIDDNNIENDDVRR
ncbi:outer membrane beta-barrel protein [Flavobacterium sp.]|uniref:TonB-dependent receptor n=1 Tax=Flavobacterium sp. TaxID=239 RepID=UPI003751053F